MKVHLLYLSLIFVLLSAGGASAQSTQALFQEVIDNIHQAHPDAIGILAHVEAPEQGVSWSGAAGIGNKNTLKPLTADQPVLIASSIKTYVAATILRLVELKKLALDNSIGGLLSPATRALFRNDGYDLDSIRVVHLLSHTSGIEDYISHRNVEDYFQAVDKDKKHRWTREEQLKLSVKKGDPLGPPGEQFSYADANYLLLAEIIEGLTQQSFPSAMRELLRYEEVGLRHTWFPTLERKPRKTKRLAHQYLSSRSWDSQDIDISWDLYGGGGIAATMADMARFSHAFFNGQIVRDPAVRELIFTEIPTEETALYPYFLGLSQDTHHGLNAYGHGGFWSTVVLHYPALNTSISVCILERDRRALIRPVLEGLAAVCKDTFQPYESTTASVKNYLEHLEDFSGAILVAHKDSIVAHRAYGEASREFEIPNRVDTKFNIASITKLFTSVATLQLSERGLLDLDKTVGYYLPDYPHPTVRDSVLIRHLLTHSSGIPPFYGGEYLQTDKLRYRKVRDFLPLFANKDLLFPPGQGYYYSGSGFVVLGLIIEQITGQDYYDYLDEQLFQAAGMTNTAALTADTIVSKRASGYTSIFGDQPHYSRNDYYLSKASPGGSHYSTVADLFQFSRAIRSGKLLRAETYAQMITPQVKGFNTHLGFGIDVDRRYAETIVGHSGGWFGVRGELMDFVGSAYTVVVLSNQDDNGERGASKVIDDLRRLIGGPRSR